MLVGRAPAANWLQYHAETGGYDVDIELDDRSPSRPYGQRGRRASTTASRSRARTRWQVIEKLNGGPLEKVKFFHMGEMTIAGKHGAHAAPRHGRRARARDLGPVRGARRDPRRDPRGRRASSASSPVGSRAYPSNTLESGWIPSPLPAIYSGEAERAYREWLPANELRGDRRARRLASSPTTSRTTTSTRGSSATARSSSSTTTSSAARRSRRSTRAAQRKKVTLAWNAEDLGKICTSLLDRERPELQVLRPAARQLRLVELRRRDRRDGNRRRPARCSPATARTSGAALSLGDGRPGRARSATEVTRRLGRAERRHRKTTVEPHEQIDVRVRVSPVPYSEVARETYADGWRTKGVVT